MSHRVRLAAAIALGAGALVVSGCGDDFAGADIESGEQTFAQLCSSCHTLEAAGTPPSEIGPNLDDAFRASREVGITEEQYAGVIQRWIKISQPPMPRDLVVGDDARDVSAYIASVAGRNDESAVRPLVPTPAVPEVSRQEPTGVEGRQP